MTNPVGRIAARVFFCWIEFPAEDLYILAVLGLGGVLERLNRLVSKTSMRLVCIESSNLSPSAKLRYASFGRHWSRSFSIVTNFRNLGQRLCVLLELYRR
jgi:hypothetical protein